jgi:hypothetical protein
MYDIVYPSPYFFVKSILNLSLLDKHMDEQLEEDLHRGTVNSMTIQYFIDVNDVTCSSSESQSLLDKFNRFASRVADPDKIRFVKEEIEERLNEHATDEVSSLALYSKELTRHASLHGCPEAMYGQIVNELLLGSSESFCRAMKKGVIFTPPQRTELARLVENLIRKQENRRQDA